MKKNISKKCIFLTIFCFCFICFNGIAFGKSPSPATPPPSISSFSFEGCFIKLLPDDQGVEITAIDPNWYGKEITQYLTIKKNKYGGITKEETFQSINRKKIFPLEQTELGYDIFGVKYLEKIKDKIPKEIKKNFFGFYYLE